ncbi:hypothetical protein IQ07DRAFT_584331 [Pyrenochaeta sp. DS3sAY3a]|nr:hypothetical protein IQ07DRAFT_584331 [Pyrenochaeta sp. DS3sAY3a]
MTANSHSTRSLDPISTSSNSPPLYDLVCVGFGAAQVATAIANREARKSNKVLFLEQKPSFAWHSSPHLSRTRMESPFMYDLATLRNPRTAFSYVNYLLAQNRLIEFANSDRLNPLREEFEHYLKWCAEQLKDDVRYGNEVISVTPEAEANVVKSWKVTVRESNGKTYVVKTKNVVAPSPSKKGSVVPQPLQTMDFLAGQRIISTSEYVTRRNELRGAHEPRLNIGVAGSGHAIAEILDDLLSCPRLGNITLVTEDASLAPLTALGEQEPPEPQLCSIWAKRSSGSDTSVTEASELVQTIYMRAYEKQVQTKGEFRLRVIMGKDESAACLGSDFIVRDTTTRAVPHSQLLQGLDALALGCQQKGESLEEVQFKRSAVQGCRLWLLANSENERALAKDLSLMAGEIVKGVSSVAEQGRDVQVQARM